MDLFNSSYFSWFKNSQKVDPGIILGTVISCWANTQCHPAEFLTSLKSLTYFTWQLKYFNCKGKQSVSMDQAS